MVVAQVLPGTAEGATARPGVSTKELTRYSIWTKGKAMHPLTRIAAIVGVVTLMVVGSTTAHEVSAAPKVVGHVYVNDNTAGTNTIGAFNQRADRTLAPLHGSPVPARGAGTGTTVGSQGAPPVTGDGR